MIDKKGIPDIPVDTTKEATAEYDTTTVKDASVGGPKHLGRRIYPKLHDIFIYWPSFAALSSLIISALIITPIPRFIISSFGFGVFVNDVSEHLTRALESKGILYVILVVLLINGYSGILQVFNIFKRNDK